MADFDKHSLANLVKLSRINISEEEQASLLVDLQKILKHVDALKEVDTEGVEPCNHVLSTVNNVLRDDVVVPERVMEREKFLNNAPDQVGGMVRVPPVIKQR